MKRKAKPNRRAAKAAVPKQKKPSVSPVIKTAAALAAELQVTAQCVSKWVRRQDWPAMSTAPWSSDDVGKIRAWRETLQINRASEATDTEDQRLKRERRRTIVIKRKALQGVLVHRDLLDAALVSLTRGFVNAIEELERSLPLQLAGLDAAQIETLIHDRVRRMREALSNQKVLELEMITQGIQKVAPNKPSRGRPRAGTQ